MTLVQLNYALAVLRHGSFKLAARELHISQPALSVQIQNLEDEIGVSLFVRNRNPLTPTEEGVLFLKKAQEIVRQCDELLGFSEEISKEYNTKLRVGVIPTLAPFLLPLFVEALQKDYPKLRLDFHEIITEKIVEGLQKGSLDMGIVSTPVKARYLVSFPLFYEKFYFYTAKKNHYSTLNPTAIDFKSLWMLEEGNCFRDQIQNFCNLGNWREELPFVYRTNSIDALIKIVDGKGGLTILPELTTLTLSEAQEERIVEIDSEKPKAREIGLLVAEQTGKRRYAKLIKEYIQGNIPKHMLDRERFEVIDPMISLG